MRHYKFIGLGLFFMLSCTNPKPNKSEEKTITNIIITDDTDSSLIDFLDEIPSEDIQPEDTIKLFTP